MACAPGEGLRWVKSECFDGGTLVKSTKFFYLSPTFLLRVGGLTAESRQIFKFSSQVPIQSANHLNLRPRKCSK
jgi:hypothetical protein